MCEHAEFASACRIGRISTIEGGPVEFYTAELRVWCEQCGAPLVFRLQRGVNLGGVSMSVDGQEARLTADVNDCQLKQAACPSPPVRRAHARPTGPETIRRLTTTHQSKLYPDWHGTWQQYCVRH